ncbi:putative glycolipid-binding domain-containing protein [Streptomyces sp. NPDC127098]|uniref:putative glycolipid-binding domain-containing protein n=1 Tax=Streptomyces sp. NPDC127098 TaxID=3347137 RepID=UPI003648530F
MTFASPPRSAAWSHQDARSGFEVAFFRPRRDGGYDIEGSTAAVEDGESWIVDYAITLDTTWTTRRARITSRSRADAARSTVLEAAGTGRWRVDGVAAPHLDGCLDVDLESSAMTNALPAHRLALPVGARSDAPAAYVRALDLTVDRLEQTYARVPDEGSHQRLDYTAPAFDFACRLVYDGSGLILAYPGIAVRAA